MNTDIHLRAHIAKEGQMIIMKDDVISRQDALKAICFLEAKNDKANVFSDDFDNISRTKSMIAINNLPSAQPMRKKGQWIPHPNKEFRETDICTACGMGTKRREYGITDGHEWMREWGYHFCPWCGADMRGEQDE